jgi:hypothetical protein
MPAVASPITRQTVGRTFITSISILGVGALLQLGAIGWVFYSRFHTTPLPAGPLTASDGAVGTRGFNDPFGDDDAPGAPPGSNPRPVIPARPVTDSQFAFQPVPIIANQGAGPQPDPEPAPETTDNSRFGELIQQARMLRERGDTSTAITRFREALALQPDNPMPTAEIASTYERMAAPEKAAEHWRRIYDMGESAGVYFTAAEAKMKVSQTEALLQAVPTTNVQELEAAAQAAQPTPRSGEAVGMFPGSRLGFGQLTMREETQPEGKKVTVRVPVRARSKARVDVNDVTIQVIFYDLLNGRTLEKTNAEVSYRWSNPPADWADEDVEVLEVSYLPPPPLQGEPVENRKFYGYLARVYYKDALQDARAEPTKLGQTYPAPRMLQPDSAP